MKDDNLDELIKYRLKRASEALEEAKLIGKINHWNTCANRLYYAVFYAVSALLIKENFSASKHSGVKSLFNRYFVKTNKIQKDFGKLYNELYNLRQEGDYLDFVTFDKETVSPLIPKTELFIDEINKLLK